MILRCLVVTVTRNRKGQPIRAAKIVAGDPVTVGRSADSTIYLPDPRVNLHHALIRINELGKLYVEAKGAPLDVNGELESQTKLRRGARILIGPYQISPEPPTSADHDFGLAIELVLPLPEGLSELREYSRTSLNATWLSKRGLAWVMFGVVASLCLALPLAHATSPRFRDVANNRFPDTLKGVAWDAGWNPGPLSVAHHPLTQKCEACHQVPFEPVQDRACVKCHQVTGEHVLDVSLRTGGLGARCAECHRDHKGEHAIVRTDATLCVDCHGDIKARNPGSKLAAITDFSTDHPQLAYRMVNASTGEMARVPADRLASTPEGSGLKFPHATHLAKAGIRSPSGPKVMACAQCHEPNAGGERFEPIRMETHCSECHQLQFEPAVTSRELPHGDPSGILTTLREFYARIALGDQPIDVTLVNGFLRKPGGGDSGVERRRALAWADAKAQVLATDIIEKRLCGQCHQVSQTAALAPPSAHLSNGPEWMIQQVAMTSRWLPGVVFDHKRHLQPACDKCHDVRSSKSSDDIAMPTLATCQSCHAGANGATGKVKSPCETCHKFHQHPREGTLSAASPELPDTTLESPPAPR